MKSKKQKGEKLGCMGSVTVDGFRKHTDELFRRLRRCYDAIDQIPEHGRWLRIAGRGKRPFKFVPGLTYLVKCRETRDGCALVKAEGTTIDTCSAWWGFPRNPTHVWVPVEKED